MTTEEANVDNLQGRMTTAETDIDNVEQDLTTHENRQDNPHTVTKTQVGLSDVNNTSDLNKPISTATQTALDLKADLVEGKVPANQLPSYVDDVLEVYVRTAATPLNSDFFSLTSVTGTALTPESGKIYLVIGAVDTDLVNTTYRWGGTHYAVIGDIALGTTAATAFPGDRGLALETLTDNIVDGDQALALKNQVIRNTVVGTSPLVVNSIASTTANLTEFQVNGTKVLEVTPAGNLLKNGNLFLHNTGSGSTGVGDRANRLGGVSATAVGHLALFSANATANTAVGHASLFDATGGGNTVIGESGGRSITTGSNNTFLGNSSGFTGAWGTQLVSAVNSTAIGNQSTTDKSNQMVFGNPSVTEFKFDRNTGAVALLPQIISTSSNATFLNRTSSVTNEFRGHVLTHTTSGDMSDGFGTLISFSVRDNANVLNEIAFVGAVRSGADNSGRLVFQTANTGTLTEKMTILPNGNVGIGTTSPANLLQVQGIASGTTLSNIRLVNNASANPVGEGTQLLFANNSGFVSAGVNSSAIGSFTTNTANGSASLLFSNYNGSTLVERMRINDVGNVGIGTTNPLTRLVVSNGSNENIEFFTGSVSLNGGGLEYINRTTFSTRPDFNFFNSNGAFKFLTAGSERLRIANNGDIGIGTSSPNARLHVQATNVGLAPLLRLGNLSNASNTTKQSGVIFEITDTVGTVKDSSRIVSFTEDNNAVNTGMFFATRASDTITERMRIASNGNVGIGTTTPNELLHVRRANLLGSTANNFVNLTRLSGLSVNEFMVNDFFVRESNGGDWETTAYVRGISVDASFLTPNSSLRSWIKQNPFANSVQFGSGSSTYLTVNPTGVGIGTTSPANLLDVRGSSAGRVIVGNFINSTNAGGTEVGLRLAHNNLDVCSVNLVSRRVGPDAGADFLVELANDSGTITERLRITETGNVGIGTTSPSNRLESVGSSATTFNGLGVYNTLPYGGANFSDKAESILNLGKIEGTARQPMGAIGASPTSNGSSDNGYLSLYTRSSGALSERMRILTNGRVGIGTTTPAFSLDVNGTIASRGAEIIAGDGAGGNYIFTKVQLLFQTGDGGTTLGIIRNTGQFGIGTTTTDAQLQVRSGATNRVPLIVDTISGFDQALGLEEFKVNTSVVARINGFGSFATLGSIFNLTNINNANITPASTGSSITRNVADTNPALIVNLANAGATEDIIKFQWQGITQASIARDGIANFTGTPSNAQTGDYTLVLADKGKVLRVNSATNRTVTIPLNSSVAFPIDTEIAILRYGTGTVSISPTAGVTLQSKSGERKISGQYGSVALKKIGENEWVLVGSLEA
jgi:hypothetical protein